MTAQENPIPNPLQDSQEVGQLIVDWMTKRQNADSQCAELQELGWLGETDSHRLTTRVGYFELVAEYDSELGAFCVSVPRLPEVRGNIRTAKELADWTFDVKQYITSVTDARL